MSELQPDNTDAILGGQTPPPVNAAVLGGVAGIEQQLINQWSLSKESISRFSFETVFVNDNAEIIERKQKEAFCYNVDLNGIPLEMVYIPAGSFLMGGFNELASKGKSAQPIHPVTLQSFFIGKYPVTQKQYIALTNRNPSRYFMNEDKHPVDFVQWDNATEFCRRLSKLTNKNFTLPSESQWEYACRAGTDTHFYFGQKISTDLSNYDECYQRKTTPVGIFPPNSWGLYDMHGNVREWCLDTMHDNYIGAPSDGSAWIDFRDDDDKRDGLLYKHPCRGGAWDDFWYSCMSYERGFINRGCRKQNAKQHKALTHKNGFRVCMLLNPDDRYTAIPYDNFRYPAWLEERYKSQQLSTLN